MPGAGVSPCMLCYHYRQTFSYPFILFLFLLFQSSAPPLSLPLTRPVCTSLRSLLPTSLFHFTFDPGGCRKGKDTYIMMPCIKDLRHHSSGNCNDYRKPHNIPNRQYSLFIISYDRDHNQLVPKILEYQLKNDFNHNSTAFFNCGLLSDEVAPIILILGSKKDKATLEMLARSA